VTTGAGTSATSSADEFTYQAPAPPRPAITSVSPSSGSAGDTVTVTGTSFGGGTVTFGLNEVPADQASCTNTSCTVTVPRGNASSTVDVRVDTAGGRSPRVEPADQFTYGGAPPPPPVSETVTADPTTALVGQQVTLTAALSADSGTPTGTVTFKVGGTTLCAQVRVASGHATCDTTDLPVGTDTVTAAYSGDGSFAATSDTTTVTVVSLSAAVTAPTAPFVAGTATAV
jgi:hypothetical protein